MKNLDNEILGRLEVLLERIRDSLHTIADAFGTLDIGELTRIANGLDRVEKAILASR